MPKQAITSFKPPSNHTKVVFITVLYHDKEGNGRYIAQDVPCYERQSVIVVATGGIVDAADRNSPWVDLSGKNHKQDPCPVCSEISSVCSLCLVESRLGKIRESIGIVQDCQLAKHLVETIERVKQIKVAERQQEMRDMIRDIEGLAKMYWKLEAKTKRAVGNVKVYGVDLKEAAVDYLKDGILTDFWRELTNMNEAKTNLESATEHHEEIKREASLLKNRAESRGKTFGEKASIASAYADKNDGTIKSVMSIPGVGQVLGGICGAVAGGVSALEWCTETSAANNIPVKIVAGAAGAVAAGTATLIGTIITIPLAPYFWYKSISSEIDAKNYGMLKEKFDSVALQMGLVDMHLEKITTSLLEIEQNLEFSQRAERKVIATLDENKRKEMTRRVIARAEDLVKAIDKYLCIVNTYQLDNALKM